MVISASLNARLIPAIFIMCKLSLLNNVGDESEQQVEAKGNGTISRLAQGVELGMRDMHKRMKIHILQLKL